MGAIRIMRILRGFLPLCNLRDARDGGGACGGDQDLGDHEKSVIHDGVEDRKPSAGEVR